MKSKIVKEGWDEDQKNPLEWACARQCHVSVFFYEQPLQPCLDPPNQNCSKTKDGLMSREKVLGKYSLLNGVARGCESRIDL